jgi:hypothetical protein
MKWLGHVMCMGEMRNIYKISVREHGGERPLGRSRCRWEDNTKIHQRNGVRSCGLDSSGSG